MNIFVIYFLPPSLSGAHIIHINFFSNTTIMCPLLWVAEFV